MTVPPRVELSAIARACSMSNRATTGLLRRAGVRLGRRLDGRLEAAVDELAKRVPEVYARIVAALARAGAVTSEERST